MPNEITLSVSVGQPKIKKPHSCCSCKKRKKWEGLKAGLVGVRINGAQINVSEGEQVSHSISKKTMSLLTYRKDDEVMQ